jgi:hypothetical protein
MSTRAGERWSASLERRGVGINPNQRNNPLQSSLPMHLSPDPSLAASRQFRLCWLECSNAYRQQIRQRLSDMSRQIRVAFGARRPSCGRVEKHRGCGEPQTGAYLDGSRWSAR